MDERKGEKKERLTEWIKNGGELDFESIATEGELKTGRDLFINTLQYV